MGTTNGKEITTKSNKNSEATRMVAGSIQQQTTPKNTATPAGRTKAPVALNTLQLYEELYLKSQTTTGSQPEEEDADQEVSIGDKFASLNNYDNSSSSDEESDDDDNSSTTTSVKRQKKCLERNEEESSNSLMDIVVLHGNNEMLQLKIPVETTVDELCTIIKKKFEVANITLLHHDKALEEGGKKLRDCGVLAHSILFSVEKDSSTSRSNSTVSAPEEPKSYSATVKIVGSDTVIILPVIQKTDTVLNVKKLLATETQIPVKRQSLYVSAEADKKNVSELKDSALVVEESSSSSSNNNDIALELFINTPTNILEKSSSKRSSRKSSRVSTDVRRRLTICKPESKKVIPMENWRLGLVVGSLLDVRCRVSLKWLHAKVCDTDGDDLKIHFLGWNKKWDVWAHRSNCNISPAGHYLKFPYRHSAVKNENTSSPDEDEEETDLREIFIETLDNRVIPVSLVTSTESTVKDVKNEIEKSQGIPVKEQELIYRGLPLLDHITLEYYQLPIKCVIGLMVPLASYYEKPNDINNMEVSRIRSQDFYAPMYTFTLDDE